MKKFLIIEPESRYNIKTVVPIEWNMLPEKIIDEIPEWYFENIQSVNPDGSVGEKTVVFMRPTRNFDKNCDKTYEINDNLTIGIKLE